MNSIELEWLDKVTKISGYNTNIKDGGEKPT